MIVINSFKDGRRRKWKESVLNVHLNCYVTNDICLYLNDTIIPRKMIIETELNIFYKHVFITYCKGKALTVMKKIKFRKKCFISDQQPNNEWQFNSRSIVLHQDLLICFTRCFCYCYWFYRVKFWCRMLQKYISKRLRNIKIFFPQAKSCNRKDVSCWVRIYTFQKSFQFSWLFYSWSNISFSISIKSLV